MTSTTTEATTQAHLTQDEIAALGRVKPSPKARVGMVASYVGMGLIVIYCILPFYWMIVSSLRIPGEGRSTEFIPNPISIETWPPSAVRKNRSRPNSSVPNG